MTLGRKGLTSGAIKGLTVFYCVSTLLCIALLCRAIQSSMLEPTGEICIVYIQTFPLSLFLGDRRPGPGDRQL
ncbi:unnamed protein product [Staurois parvus]|uniref:Uncharacterized protein n=1 Tax=Staurois parvus TaxID=386267 RepID=A0ABN9AWM0_9NEOB|nr:unnamed protein product [Staurois parvus]